MKAFTERFPKIKFACNLDISKYLDGIADMTYDSTKGKDHGADVAVLQSVHNFPRWKSQGRLLPYKVASWNDIQPEFVDPDGAYTGLHICESEFLQYFLEVTLNIITNSSYPRIPSL